MHWRCSGHFRVTRRRIVLLGDSITVGCRETGVTAQTTYPSYLKRQLGRAGLDVELIVSALHGVYMGYAVRRFERMVGRHNPNYVMIMLGANDAVPAGRNSRTSPEDFQTALESLVRLCTLTKATAIIASPPPRSDARSSFLLKSYAETARSIADQSELPFIDLFTTLNEERFLNKLLPDCQHPSPAANRIIADLVLDCLRAVPELGGNVSSSSVALTESQTTETTQSLSKACPQARPTGSP